MLPLAVEVALAFRDHQRVYQLKLPAGSDALTAVRLSGALEDYPQLGNDYRIGIFGRVLDQPQQYQLQAGDRIEIYRPLINKPRGVS